MIVVSDTTAISNLIQIGRLYLLQEIYQYIVIPASVRRELDGLKTLGYSTERILGEEWIEVKTVSNREKVNELLDTLDIGEAESIALALSLKADYILMDELVGRELAKENRLKIIGTLGILIEAKKRGLIFSLEEEIVSLKKIGFWISDKLRDHILRLERNL